MVVGAADAGKTTFIAWLANVLHARGLRVGIVDADIGQSEIGPPATVGLGAVHGPIARSGDAELVTLAFVGVTSPGRRPWQTADAVGRMVRQARPMFDRVLVDTSGFVAGGFAAAVKQRKITIADPDIVVMIQTHDECEHLIRPLTGRARPAIVRLPAVIGGQPRSQAARRRRRAESLARYLAAAKPMTVSTAEVRVLSLRDEPVRVATIAPHTIVALEDAHGGVLGVGVIDGVDERNGTLAIRATAAAVAVSAVRVGEASAG
jgi:polynucleotide 5'-hydroxyl-kinase GRC3/NOL9